MVDFIFKPMAKIYYEDYGLLKIFVILDKGFHISPRIFFEKNVIFQFLADGAGYMGHASYNMGHPYLHVLLIAEG